MSIDQQLDTPAYQNPDFKAQLQDWQIVNDVYQGTNGVQRLSTTNINSRVGGYAAGYLPREPAETEADYYSRVRRSVFWNAFRRTIQGLTGMVFRKNPVLGEDVPPQISELIENIDLEGNHIDVFAKDVFKTALIDGHAFILVDMPETPLEDAATLADEQALGVRPYWCKINKNQIVNWQYENHNGRLVLTLVSIRENVTEPAGIYRQQRVTQYRVLTPGRFAIYRQAEQPTGTADTSGAEWVLYREGTTSLDFIPLVTIYTHRLAYLVSDPPLLDFARENLRHYRLQSDLDHILHIANVPILTAIGRDRDEDKVEIGGNRLFDLPLGGELKYVEHAGAAIGKAQEEIERSKGNMAALGLLLLAQKPQVKSTATEAVLEYEAESSELAGMARGLQDGLEKALDYTALYLGLGTDDGGTITVNRDFGHKKLDALTISALTKMVSDNQLTLETMWKMLEEGELLPEDFDAEIERKQLETTVDSQQRKLSLDRQRMAAEADKQALTGNPEAIRQRLIDATSGTPPS